MRKWTAVLVALVGVLTSSAAAQQDDEPRTVTTRVRHVTTLVLPRGGNNRGCGRGRRGVLGRVGGGAFGVCPAVDGGG